MPSDASAQDILEQEPGDVADRATGIGRERLDRTPVEIFLTALIGGLEVSLGGLAAMAVVGPLLHAVPGAGLYGALAVGGLAFPIGFLLVLVGRSELFTENFLIPVTAVIRGDRPLRSLGTLWVLSWIGNVLGCVVMALLLSVPDAIGEPIKEGYRAYAAYKLDLPPLGVFVSSILAGMVMTSLTWLLLSMRHAVGRVIAIFAVGYLLFAANLSHAIVGAAELFVGFAPAGHSVLDVLVWVLLSTVGNMVGGLGLVTLFRDVQVREGQDRLRASRGEDQADESLVRDPPPTGGAEPKGPRRSAA